MFLVNESVLVLCELDGRREWFNGKITERRVPICNHQPDEKEDCLVCLTIGNPPRYDVMVHLCGKDYLAKNVSPANLRRPIQGES